MDHERSTFTKEEAEALQNSMIADRDDPQFVAKVDGMAATADVSDEYHLCVSWNHPAYGFEWAATELIDRDDLATNYCLLDGRKSDKHWQKTKPPSEEAYLAEAEKREEKNREELERMISERAKQIMAKLAKGRDARGR